MTSNNAREEVNMHREDAALIVSIASLIIAAVSAIGTLTIAWYTREGLKRRGRHRR